ncbi:AAA family ATPase [Hydrogenophaga aromaticivorans]|uniref:AAA family ATPase n=1 Tax=Hydrogenophaga aromaticivorans TaxID=2610898 RepID=UPI0031B5CB47
MRPIRLTLNGFTGIASGRSKSSLTIDLDACVPAEAQLVAIFGPNGSGKTTIIDNLHPYRLMPSRANQPVPSAFSYYDHLVGGEGGKELVWEHQGVRYLSSLRFRSTAKTKKQEAFLFVYEADGSTQPWCDQATGLKSDGKAENYDRCIEAVVGKPEVFFAAQFSAQGRTPIAAMTATEVKKLLADMLGMDRIAALAGKASEVAKLLKPRLSSVQDQAMRTRQSVPDVRVLQGSLDQALANLEGIEACMNQTAAEITQVTVDRAALTSSMERQISIRSQHEAVDEQILMATSTGASQIAAIVAKQKQGADAKLVALQEAKNAVQVALNLKQQLQQRCEQLDQLVSRSDQIGRARKAMDQLIQDRAKRLCLIEDSSKDLSRIDEVRRLVESLSASLAKLTSDGAHLKAALELAQSTAMLLREVPCGGTAMAGRCKLLAQANEAAVRLPQQEMKLQKARDHYRIQNTNCKGSTNELVSLQEKEAVVKVAQRELNDIEAKIAECRETLALRETIESAQKELPGVRAELTKASQSHLLAQETVRRRQEEIVAGQQADEAELSKAQHQVEQGLLRLRTFKQSLPKLLEASTGEQLDQLLQAAKRRHEEQAGRAEEVRRRIASIKASMESAAQLTTIAVEHEDRAQKIAMEMSRWTLLSKALGTDGVIAMSIDDAGPMIASFANSLLEDCYGGRFVLAIQTQTETAAGMQKEAFNVMVEDTTRGENKSLDLMSGGEKVWINECLVRAIALYMASICDIRYETIFSDEADGALDPERKRQYMAMKRAVLQRGGYSREYLITQTPELLSLCDGVIDVTTL